ncbi:MAG: PH domain-containing protein [bacterium]
MKYETYQRLSTKTFFIMLLQNSFAPITISFIWIGLVFVKTIDMENVFTFQNSEQIVLLTTKVLDFALVLGLLIALFAWLIAIIRTLINHMTFYFMLDEQGISIKQGLIHKNETTTPYRHIENVDMDQPLFYRMFGMCRLHIITGGEDDDNNHSHQTEIKFPFVEKTFADDVRKEIFSRTSLVSSK